MRHGTPSRLLFTVRSTDAEERFAVALERAQRIKTETIEARIEAQHTRAIARDMVGRSRKPATDGSQTETLPA